MDILPAKLFMRLRTFEAYWLVKNGLLYTYPLLQKNISTDILIIGGGITGALISHTLVEKGFDCVLIDRRDIGQGSTSATTSMLQYEIDEPLVKLAEMIGESKAALCYKAGIDALNTIGEIVKSNNIDCGFETKKSLYVAHNKRAAKELQEECNLRNKYKLGVQWLDAAQVENKFGLVCEGGILSDKAASVDAYKLAHELIAKSAGKGLQVFDQTEIKTINAKGKKPYVETEKGYKVTARKIMFCNGFESTNLLKEKIADLIYTYATISEPMENLPKPILDTLIWNTEDPYLYMRSTSEGRILVGGEDDTFKDSPAQQKIKEKKSAILQRKVKKLMPALDFVEDFSWGGVFGTTKDGLPYIGESKEYKNCLWVLGFGGNGITFSAQATWLILQLLEGKMNDLANCYRFGR